jgi:integrase/recombinase XerC
MQGLVGDYVSERVALGQLRGKSPQNAVTLLGGFARWCDHNELTVDTLTKRDVTRYLVEAGGAASSQRTRLSQIRTFLAWCVDNDLCVKNAAAGIKLGKLPEREPRFLEPEEVTAVFTAVRARDTVRVSAEVVARDACIVAFAVQLGMRRGEIHACNVEDLDRTNRVIGIRGKGHNGEISRRLGIPGEAWEMLIGYLSVAPCFQGALFRSTVSRARLSERAIGVQIANAMTRAGVKHAPYDGKSLHALRHSFAQHLIDAGVDIRDVQEGMGHGEQRTTEIYLRRRKTAEQLRNVIEGRRYA